PGSPVANLAVSVVQLLRGPWAALYCLLPFMLPGAVIMFGVSLLLFHAALPVWANHGLLGGAAGALGLLLATTLQMANSARKAKYWMVFLPVAALASAILQGNFLLLLVGL